MSLGETICRLRGERNMSQGDLAELLDVSRQSVSRWETGSAVPELEKLVKLSKIFGVTLDELVSGAKSVPAPETAETVREPIPAQMGNKFPPRKIVGTVLLCTGLLAVLLCTLLGSLLSGLLLASPFLLCGAICFLFQRHVGLWCGWTVFLAVDVYLRYATGINWWLTWFTLSYEPSMNYMRLFIAWCQLLCMIFFVFLTVFTFRKKRIELTVPIKIILAGNWLILIFLLFIVRIPVRLFSLDYWLSFMLLTVFDWARLALLTALLVITFCVFHRNATARGSQEGPM